MPEQWWQKCDNIVSLIVAASGVGLVLLHVVLQANGQLEVSKYLDGIGLTGAVGVMAIMGSGLFAALQRQNAYLQTQVRQGEKMIGQADQAAVKVAEKVSEVKHEVRDAVKQAITESVRAEDLRGRA